LIYNLIKDRGRCVIERYSRRFGLYDRANWLQSLRALAQQLTS